MEITQYFIQLLGGALIGLAVSLMLYWNGRVAGVSGIIYGAMIAPKKKDISWRWFFITGMILGGLILRLTKPSSLTGSLPTQYWTLIVAGLLVGFGTVLGSGCTSGHGVCGISRLSPRSLIATITFMAAGVLSVIVFRKFGVVP